MGNEAKREFLGLDVNEVSLVDSAANEEEFVVLKSLSQEDEMADEKNTENVKDENISKSETANNNEVEKVSIDVEKATNKEVAKVMDKVTELVDNIAKAANVKKEEEVKKEKTTREVFKEQLEANGTSEENVKKALEKFDDVEKKQEKQIVPCPGATAVQKPKEEEVKKASDPLDMITEAIQKAKSLTPERQDIIQKAAEALQSLHDEISGVDADVKKATNKICTEKQNDSDDPTVTKTLEDIAKSISSVVEVQKQLTEKVENIEKERMPSNSLTDEAEATDSKEVDTEKSLWSNVL